MSAALDSALSGALAPPPRESWRRFEMDTVLDRYLEVLLGRHAVTDRAG